MTLPISVVILTFNAEATVARTLESAARISDDIHVVDSGSTDGTLAIVRAAGAAIAAHPFVDYGAQRNWAIDHLELRHGWQLHLDADERLSDAAVTEIQALVDEPGIDGYLIPRLVHFKRLRDPEAAGTYKDYPYPDYTTIPFDPVKDDYPYPPEAVEMTYDGLHPSDKGCAVIAKKIIRLMKRL